MVLHLPTGTSRCSSREPLNRLFRSLKRLLTQSLRTFSLCFPSVHRDNDRNSQPPSSADQRSNARIHLTDTTVQVTDGCLFATALIDNISLCGICLHHLPEQLYRSDRQLTVFSSDNPGIPILHIQPQWQDTGWDGKTIGATILNASETWRLFFVHSASRRMEP